MKAHEPFSSLSNQALLAETVRLVGAERIAIARLIAALAEVDARRLYLSQGYSSLFTYCTGALHLSEHAAYGRIEAARAARRFPIVLDLLEDGSLTLTNVGLLAKHLTPENHRVVLDAARHKSKSEVERQVAALRPQPNVASSVRKLPEPKVLPEHAPAARLAAPVASHPKPAVVRPLAPERYKVQFTVTEKTYDKLRRAQDLLRHCMPNGDPAAIFDRALTLLVADLEKRKAATTTRPRPARRSATSSRHIPAAVRREVWRRDGGCCGFIGADGRCSETGFLEFHHVTPFAEGGASTAANIQLRCRAHNAYEAEQWFGPMFVRERSSVWTELDVTL